MISYSINFFLSLLIPVAFVFGWSRGWACRKNETSSWAKMALRRGDAILDASRDLRGIRTSTAAARALRIIESAMNESSQESTNV